MNPLIKQRLVGTVVLVALGIVFWPLIFDAPDVHDPIVLKPLSEKPVVDRTPIPAPESFEATVIEALPDTPTIDSGAQLAADEDTRTEADAIGLEALSGADELTHSADLTAQSTATLWSTRRAYPFSGCYRWPQSAPARGPMSWSQASSNEAIVRFPPNMSVSTRICTECKSVPTWIGRH